MHYFEINDGGDTHEKWYSVHNPSNKTISIADTFSEAKEIVNYLNGGNRPKPVVCIQGKRINLGKVVGYEQDGNEIAFFLHGAADKYGSNPEIILYFESRTQAHNCIKWLDSLLNVVEYKPETLQNRE